MPKLVKYAIIGGGSLDKAVCEICQKAYGNLDAARECEKRHYSAMLKATQENMSPETWEKILEAFIEADLR